MFLLCPKKELNRKLQPLSLCIIYTVAEHNSWCVTKFGRRYQYGYMGINVYVNQDFKHIYTRGNYKILKIRIMDICKTT